MFHPNGASSMANGGSYAMGDPIGSTYPLPMIMRALVLPPALRPV